MHTIKLITCDNSFQANVIKGRLENEGIPCFLKNENFNFLYGGINSNSIGVDIMINEEDLEKAEAIINDTNDE